MNLVNQYPYVFIDECKDLPDDIWKSVAERMKGNNMSNKPSFEDLEKQRLDQIENEAERNSSRVKGADILAELDIKDEYFDEPCDHVLSKSDMGYCIICDTT